MHSIVYSETYTQWVRADGISVISVHNDYGQTKPPEGELFASITPGNWFSCALRPDGSPVCWGYDMDGQSTPPEGEKLIKISGGYGHTCGIGVDGTLSCWGRNLYGEANTFMTDRFISIDSSFGRFCDVRADGTTLCEGNDGSVSNPLPPLNEGSTFSTISTSNSSYVCGLRSNGSVFCSGGHQDFSVGPQDETFRSISVTYSFACGLRLDGSPVCWSAKKTTAVPTNAPQTRASWP